MFIIIPEQGACNMLACIGNICSGDIILIVFLTPRCLVVIPKRSTVLHIKQALCNLLGSVVSTNHITLAHVKNCSIELILVS